MKIITPLKPRSRNELFALAEKTERKADVFEIWLDQIHWAPSYTKDLKSKYPQTELLGVCKTTEEGGSFEKTNDKKSKILYEFLESGGDFIDLDIERNSLKNVKKTPPEKLWLSVHNYDRVPENLEEIYKMMQFFSPYGYKFALTPRTPQEMEQFFDFLKAKQPTQSFYNRTPKPNIIATTMGEKYGHLGREEIKREDLTWGAFYAIDKNNTTASGQPTLEDI